jgi:hypothetical protein
MKNASSKSLLVVALGSVLWMGCVNPSNSTETASEPLVVNRSQNSGATLGFYFLPPISWNMPSHFTGEFDPGLSPTVRIDQIDSSGSTIATVATLQGDDASVRRHPWREFYIARYNTAGLDPTKSYRIRVLVDDKELGAVDLAVVAKLSDLKNVDIKRFTPVVVGEILPIKFRIERSAADQDGDGVPDWKDNCPTIYNPPVPVGVDTPPNGPPPLHCDYNTSDCDPQEVDCHHHTKLEQPDVCSCPGNGASCTAPDACHAATMCDPSTGSCGVTALPDGTSCSDGNACNGVETCQGGVCTPGTAPTCSATNACTAGVCDPINGCQVTAVADGISCSLPNGSGVCTGGVCGTPTCDSGFGNCDGNASNGCEDTVSSDVNNCGACGNVCQPSCQAVVFSETWESGSGAWRALDGGQILLQSDGMGTPCGEYQHETASASGGRVGSTPGIPMNSGATYCLGAWIRGSNGATPFLGIELTDAAGDRTFNEHWLIGLSGYTTNYGTDVVTPVTSDGNWAWYTKTFVMDNNWSDIFIKDENFGGGTADFDTIELYAGACPAAPTSVCAAPAPNCQAAACISGVCASPKL